MSYEIVFGAAVCFVALKGLTYFNFDRSTIKEGVNTAYDTLYSIIHAKQTEDRVSELESILNELKADMVKFREQVPNTQGSYVKLNGLQSNLLKRTEPERSMY